MRWLFLFVFFLNVFYVVWQANAPARDPYDSVRVLRNVEPVILIRELDNGGQNELMAAIEDVAQEVEGESVSVAVLEPEVVPAERCFTLGPFREQEKLQSLKKEIKPYVVDAVIRNREEKEHTVHWVYIQPEKNRKSIVEVGKRLKANKIKDFYIIRKGEKNNGISLGHFKNKARAFGMESKIKKLGFNVQVEPMYKTYQVFWLDYQLLGDDVPDEVIERHVQSVDGGKVGRLSRDCDA